MRTTIIALKSPSELDRNVRTYFYGAAKLGRSLFEAMGDLNTWRFDGFVDSSKAGEYLGFPVFDLPQFAKRVQAGDQIVITSGFIYDISRNLSHLSIEQAYDANTWHAKRNAADLIRLLLGGVPLRDGTQYCGTEVASLVSAQNKCDRSDFDGAEADLMSAEKRAPDLIAVLSMLAYVRWAQNRPSEALRVCRRVLSLEPQNRVALNRLGRIQFQQHLYEEVAETAKRLLELDPDDVWAVVNFYVATLRSRPISQVSERLENLAKTLSSARRRTVGYLCRLASYLEQSSRYPETLAPGLRLASTGRKRFVLSLTAFGDEYVEDLLRFALPSLLADGNLDFWAATTDSMLLIVTNASMAARIKASRSYTTLSRVLKCEIVSFPDDLVLDESALKYQLLGATLMHAVQIAKANASGLLFLAPDLVFSSHFMEMLWGLVQRGKEVVFCCMHGIEKRDFYAAAEVERYRDGPRLSIDAQSLSRIGLPLLPAYHVRTEYHDGGVMSHMAWEMNWRLPDGGIVTHRYHHHPLLFTEVALESYNGDYFQSNDSDFLSFIGARDPQFANCVLVPDGEDGIAFELVNRSTQAIHSRSIPPLSDHEKIAAIGVGVAPVHRWLMKQRVVYTARPLEASAEILSQADAVVADICARIDRIHQQYGIRDYANGYVPFPNLGFPEFPVEV